MDIFIFILIYVCCMYGSQMLVQLVIYENLLKYPHPYLRKHSVFYRILIFLGPITLVILFSIVLLKFFGLFLYRILRLILKGENLI